MSSNKSLEVVRVVFDYEPQNSDELPLKIGEKVTVLEKSDNGWWKGEKNGQIGNFPMNHVEPLSTTTPDEFQQRISQNVSPDGKERAIALVDHQPKGASQLEFKKDDIIVVLDKFPTGWWKGEVNGKVGIFPKNTVRLLDSPQQTSPKESPIITTTTTTTDTNKRTKDKKSSKEKKSKRKKEHKEKEKNISITEGLKKANSSSLSITTPSSNSTSPIPSPTSGRSPQQQTKSGTSGVVVVTAISNYKATRSDQLSFNKGDKILIHEKRESGWWRGELNGVIGFVPCNYVKEDNILENTPQNLPRTESVENSTLGSHVKTSSGYTSPRTNNVNSNLGEVVVAQYTYTPSGPGQLRLKKGDHILVLEKNDSGWWRGECNGNVGLFPSNYVKSLSESQNVTETEGTIEVEDETTLRTKKPIGKARVIYSYQGSSNVELTIEPNQIVTILGKLANGWWQGELNGRYGYFPGDYVEEIVEDSTTETNNETKNKPTNIRANQSDTTTDTKNESSKTTFNEKFSTQQTASPSGRKPPDKPLPPLPPSVKSSTTTTTTPNTKTTTTTTTTTTTNTSHFDAHSSSHSKSPPTAVAKLSSTTSSNSTRSLTNPSTNVSSTSDNNNINNTNVSETYHSRGVSKALSKNESVTTSPSLSSAASLSTPPEIKESSTTSVTSSSGATENSGLTLDMIKNALILLQQQTKTAVDELLKRIDTQHKERMKLEFVMRDMKKCLKEELHRREQLETSIQLLVSYLKTLKSEERPPQMNITSKEELIDYITTLNKTLENEIQARKELEKQVLQLRKDIEVLVERIEKLSK